MRSSRLRSSVEFDAQVRRRGRPGAPTEAGVSKPRSPGGRTRVVDGQLDLDGREHRAPRTS
jgi:hypothetical protein